ncbi:uncharacterized protein LOC114480713 isoform X2 [Gouania willdenowi]|uniref:uncharacterized protein LOC114480713 isoform X2 n=1 Tax=Gouania willdenowi TaxID=441366 RepID=UPI001056B711|nr:uncharacterized protein LOC114480713 isoform X2 [Gouania willdenowi]
MINRAQQQQPRTEGQGPPKRDRRRNHNQKRTTMAVYPQGYFIPPEQYSDPCMPPTQQYPVTTGSAGFYPGTIPAKYPGYGAYYPEQPQYPQYVEPTPVMIDRAQQQPQVPPPQQPRTQRQGPPKRERIRVTIRDPNQGGRDITEDIMSGRCYNPTPAPQETSLGDIRPPQTNGEVLPPVTALTSKEFPTRCETPATAKLVLMEEAKQGEFSRSAPVEALNEVPVNAPVRPSESSLWSPSDMERRVLQRSSTCCEHGDREQGDHDWDHFDRSVRVDGWERNPISKRSFSRESQERGGRSGDNRASNELVCGVPGMTDYWGSGSEDQGDLLSMFFNIFYVEDLIQEKFFSEWE